MTRSVRDAALMLNVLAARDPMDAATRAQQRPADYTASLYGALTQPYAPYEKIGIRQGDDYKQLNTTLLQIENEFYSTVRTSSAPRRRCARASSPAGSTSCRSSQRVRTTALTRRRCAWAGSATRATPRPRSA